MCSKCLSSVNGLWYIFLVVSKENQNTRILKMDIFEYLKLWGAINLYITRYHVEWECVFPHPWIGIK